VINVLAAGAGGFFGCSLRYLLSSIIYRHSLISGIPLGTLAANLLGSFIIGLIGGYTLSKAHLPPALNALIVTGFLGGLTTFSSFSLETYQLYLDGLLFYAALNIILQLVGCLTATAIGIKIFL